MPLYSSSLCSFLLLWLAIVLTSAQDLLASLDYGTFEGAYSSEYNISYWMKIPFAAPPIGENRFRAPQPPIPITNGTYDSTQSFDYCPQRTASISFLSSSLETRTMLLMDPIGKRYRRLLIPRSLLTTMDNCPASPASSCCVLRRSLH